MVTADFLQKASKFHLVALSLAAGATLIFWPKAFFSLTAGGLTMAANFWLLQMLVQKAFSGPNPKWSYAIFLAVKLVAVMAVMAALVLIFKLDPLPFALGLGTFFLGVGAATVALSSANRSTQTLPDPPASAG